MNSEDYQTALDLCNSRKQAGAFDSTLFTYYEYCYMGLEKYEEFVDYLIGIIKNYPSDVYSLIEVSSDDYVSLCISKVYLHLSARKKGKLIIFIFSQILMTLQNKLLLQIFLFINKP